MRARAAIVAGLLAAAVPLDSPAQAQLSPQGIIGSATRPLRQMLGHFGHFPRSYRHRSSSGARAAAPAPDRDAQGAVKSRLGRAGPAAWVTAYEDVLGFAFWPDDYGAQFRSRGFDVIADTITGRIDRMRGSTRVATTGAARSDGGTDVSSDQCNDAASADDQMAGQQDRATVAVVRRPACHARQGAACRERCGQNDQIELPPVGRPFAA